MQVVEKSSLDILQHTLGLDPYGQGTMFRNHFVAGPDDAVLCRQLVAQGLMIERVNNGLTGGSPWFSVTPSGKDVVVRESPKPPKVSRSKLRYQRFLEHGDGFDSFRDFLRWDSARIVRGTKNQSKQPA